MRLYVMCIVFVCGLLIVGGIIAPALISAKDTLYVFGGFGLLLVAAPLFFLLGNKIIKEVKEKIK